MMSINTTIDSSRSSGLKTSRSTSIRLIDDIRCNNYSKLQKVVIVPTRPTVVTLALLHNDSSNYYSIRRPQRVPRLLPNLPRRLQQLLLPLLSLLFFSSVSMHPMIQHFAECDGGLSGAVAFTTTTTHHHHSRNQHQYRNRCNVVAMVQQSSSSSSLSTNTPIDKAASISGGGGGVMIGTDPTTKPNYDQMVGPFGTWVDEFCLTLFRNQLRDEVLRSYYINDDNDQRNEETQKLLRADPMYYGKANYSQVVALAAAMNARYGKYPSPSTSAIQQSALNVLISLFPKWLPKWYRILFAQPFPIFSAKMNAYVTAALGVWLMGECTVNDIDIPVVDTYDTFASMANVVPATAAATTTTTASTTTRPNTYTTAATSSLGKNQGVLVTRCRFLEESQCASICIHSCKIPTQNFFLQQMGVPLLMEPNYTTGSCQFSFGRYPNTTTETVLIQTPCLSRCPTSGSYRSLHMTPPTNIVSPNVHLNTNITTLSMSSEAPICSMIEMTAN